MVEAAAKPRSLASRLTPFVAVLGMALFAAACETIYTADDVPKGGSRFSPPGEGEYNATPDQIDSFSFVDALVARERSAIWNELQKLEDHGNQDVIHRVDRERALLIKLGLDDDWDIAKGKLELFKREYTSFLIEVENIDRLHEQGRISHADAYARLKALGMERATYLTSNNPHEIAKELSSISHTVNGIITRAVVRV